MTKKVLLSIAVISTLTITGCATTGETVSSAAQGTAKGATGTATSTVANVAGGALNIVKGATNTVTSTVGNVANDAGDMAKSATNTVPTSTPEVPSTPSMTDMATDKVIEIADEKTNGAASQVMDVLK